jgi:hypothetical protein
MRTCNSRPDRGPHYLVRGYHLLAEAGERERREEREEREERERERRERRERASYGGIGYHNLITLLSRLSCAVFRISIIAMLTDR